MEKQNNCPALRFPEFTEGWKKKELINAVEINPTIRNLPKEFIYIDLESVVNGLLLKEKLIDITEAPSRAQRLLEKGDILFQMVRPYQKNNFYFDKDGKYVASTGYAQIRTKNDAKFIYQYLHYQPFVDKVIERCTGTSYPAINSTDLGSISISLPEIVEQQKIASFLTSVDERIAQLTKKKALLEQYKKGVMQKIFSQEIRFKDDNGKEFPNWEEKRLGEITNIKKGEQLNTTELLDIGIYPALNGGINPSGYTDKWNTPENTISISEGGNSCGFVNFNKQKFWSGGHCYTLQQIKTDVYIHFLYQELKFNEQNLMSLRVGSGLPNIQKKDLINFILPIPTHKEQTKIANFLSAIDKKIEGVAEVLEATQRWKKGLLQQMFC